MERNHYSRRLQLRLSLLLPPRPLLLHHLHLHLHHPLKNNQVKKNQATSSHRCSRKNRNQKINNPIPRIAINSLKIKRTRPISISTSWSRWMVRPRECVIWSSCSQLLLHSVSHSCGESDLSI